VLVSVFCERCQNYGSEDSFYFDAGNRDQGHWGWLCDECVEGEWGDRHPKTRMRLLEERAERLDDQEWYRKARAKYNTPEHRQHVREIEVSLAESRYQVERHAGRTIEQQKDWERNYDLE
jgi:IS1 family transposase